LIRGLLPRKTRFGSSKGISTVVGTIFLVLAVFTISTSIFLYTLTQNMLYNQAVKESHQLDLDRFSERIVAYNTNYSVPQAGKVEVKVIISNQGPLSAQIITAWVTWTYGNDRKYGSQTLNINLNPGDTVTPTIEVTVPGVLPAGVFNGWLVTARGNLVALEEKKVIVTASVAYGVGSIMMDLYNFRYYKYKSGTSNVLDKYPQGTVSFYIPSSDPVAFGVTLTNFDEHQRMITLDPNSLLWVIVPVSDVPHSVWWYIVNVYPNGTIAPRYSSVSLKYGEPTLIIFASSSCLTFTQQRKMRSGEPAAVNLLLHGTIGDELYGQNIPFVSLYFN